MVPDLIKCFKFGDNRFRGLASAEGQILPFPIDFDGRPYNALTLPCERVIWRGSAQGSAFWGLEILCFKFKFQKSKFYNGTYGKKF